MITLAISRFKAICFSTKFAIAATSDMLFLYPVISKITVPVLGIDRDIGVLYMVFHPFFDGIELLFAQCQFLYFYIVLGKIRYMLIVPVGNLHDLVFGGTSPGIFFQNRVGNLIVL